MSVTEFVSGRQYRWTGSKTRRDDWEENGEMDFMLDGAPHTCVTGGPGIRAIFADDGIRWYWFGAAENMEEVTVEDYRISFVSKNKFRLSFVYDGEARDFVVTLGDRYPISRVSMIGAKDQTMLRALHNAIKSGIATVTMKEVPTLSMRGRDIEFDAFTDGRITYCNECKSLEFADDLVETTDGRMCVSCTNKLYVKCEHCGDVLRKGRTIIECEGHTYCRSCADEVLYRCQACGNKTHNDDGLCDEHKRTHTICQSCGEAVPKGSRRELDGLMLCNGCYRNAVGGTVHSYDYRPAQWNMFGDGPLFMGVEQEMDDPSGESSLEPSDFLPALNKETEAFLKRDGSLEHGLELVHHPRSIDSWYKDVSRIELIQDIATDMNLRSHDVDTCGLHVHVDRKGLSTLNVGGDVEDKIIFLVEKFMFSHLLPLSRRKKVRLVRWARPLFEEGKTHNLDLKEINERKGTGDRYTAVNLTNSKTIEFRFFKGTLNPRTLLASLELVHNLCSVACTTPEDRIGDVSFADIATGQYLPDYCKLRKVEV